MFCPGDLIRDPTNVGLVRVDNRNLIDGFKTTQSPKMGIFVKYRDKEECVINTDGENWIVSLKSIRIMENRNDKISSNN